ncbi:MAG TPA: MFS transporter [Thermoplasmata archaeon]
MAEPLATESAWAALATPAFRALWIAALVSNLGTWIQDVGEVWTMTSLTTSPLLIALVETATTLPVFALAIPAGAIADVLDRRRFLLVSQGWMLAVALAMFAVVSVGAMSTTLLLVLIALLGVGTALTLPALSAIIPEIVPRSQLSSAVTLNGVTVNVARALGPAIGGLLVAVAGPAATFGLNSLSFVGMIVVLFVWRRPVSGGTLPAEDVVGAMRVGLRYVRHAPAMRAVLARVAGFAFPASAIFALLPVLARIEIGVDAAQYGVLLGSLGTGAIAGAVGLPRLGRLLPIDRLAVAGGILFAGVLGVLALTRNVIVIGAAAFLSGVAWIAVLSTFNIAAQTAAPAWVRARALAVYLLVFFGGYALGAFAWGALAARVGLSGAFAAAGGVLLLTTAASARYRLSPHAGLDLTPSRHWPEPILRGYGPEDVERPAKVTVEYRIDPSRTAEFLEAIRDQRRMRLRDGALRWDLAADAAEPGRFVESYDIESWTEHLRQHERVTVSDRQVEARVQRFHVGPEAPTVRHFLVHAVPSKRPESKRRKD